MKKTKLYFLSAIIHLTLTSSGLIYCILTKGKHACPNVLNGLLSFYFVLFLGLNIWALYTKNKTLLKIIDIGFLYALLLGIFVYGIALAWAFLSVI